MFITRKQYDQLVKGCYAWMQRHWHEYTRSWELNGVYVTGNLENLQAQLDWCEQYQTVV